MKPGTECVQFIHLNKDEPRGTKEFKFHVDLKFFEKIGVDVENKAYMEGDGSAQKFLLSMINSKTRELFTTPSGTLHEDYVHKGKNNNEKMDYAFFLLFEYLSDKPFVSGHVKDGLKSSFPRKVFATVVSQGGSVFQNSFRFRLMFTNFIRVPILSDL